MCTECPDRGIDSQLEPVQNLQSGHWGTAQKPLEVERKSKVQLFWVYYSEVKNYIYTKFRACIGKLRSCATRW